MTVSRTKLANLLDRLEKYYGKPKPPWPTTPYEMVLHRNCGYPQSDALCTKGFRSLQKHVGLRPKDILAASHHKLVDAMREGGMVAELRAARLLEIATRTQDEFGGDLRIVLKKAFPEAKKALKTFPHDRRSRGGQDIAIYENYGGRHGTVQLHPRATTTGFRRCKDELRSELPFGTSGHRRQITGALWQSHPRLPSSQTTRRGVMQKCPA